MSFLISKKFIRLLLYFVGGVSLLLIFYLTYTYFTTPDVKKWRKENPKKTAFMRIRENDQDYLKHRKHKIYKWISYPDIPELLRRTVIVAEDASFWIHEGIDWFELQESIKKNIGKQSFRRGGSTITQQLARNLYLSPERTINRKVREWFIARELENHLKKSRILEIYLNIAEWGYNIFGIKAACLYYFKKLPTELELHEMVRLAAVLPNPLEMDPRAVSRSVLWRSNEILRRLLIYEFIDESEYQIARQKIGQLAGQEK
jgi:monofunctional biosynthetic peptidoglycan transglycosylase